MDEHDWVALGDMLRRARHSLPTRPVDQWHTIITRLREADRTDVATWLQDMVEVCYGWDI